MTYRENVQTLCDGLGLANPLQESDLTIAKMIFSDYTDGPNYGKKYEVLATDMNRAGRLFLQQKAGSATWIFLDSVLKVEAAEFFTSELWDDCSPQKRPLVYGIKECTMVEFVRK